MENKIDIELAKLQDQLGLLENAVSHISKAEQLSNEVIIATRAIQQGYSDQLQTLLAQYNEFLNKSYTHTADQIIELSSTHRKQAEQVQNILNRYEDYLKSAENQSKENFQNGINEYQLMLQTSLDDTSQKVNTIIDVHQQELAELRKFLKQNQEQIQLAEQQSNQRFIKTQEIYQGLATKTFDDVQNQVRILTNSHFGQVEKVNSLLREYQDFVTKTEQRSNDHLKQGMKEYGTSLNNAFNDSQKQITRLATMHTTQVDETKKLINEFLEVAMMSTKMSDKFDSINFPKQLNSLNSATSTILNELSTTKNKLQTIETETRASIETIALNLKTEIETNNKITNDKLRSHDVQFLVVKVLMIIAIAVSAGVGILVFLK